MLAVLILILGLALWVWFGLPLHVNTSGNSTIALNEISAQSIPTIINGITTSINIIIAFSVALIGILLGYFFKDDNSERDFMIMGLADFTLPVIFEFGSYFNLAFGQELFETAFKLALTGLLYSMLFLFIILMFTSYRMHERTKKIETSFG